MNNGMFGLPGISDSRFIEAVQFDSTGVYVIPSKAKTLLIYATAAGGGGGGGRRGAISANAGGGGGGGGGAWTIYPLKLDEYNTVSGNANIGPNKFSSLLISIGAGGTSGAGSTTNGGTAGSGGIGGDTTISFVGASGNLIFLRGGAGGAGGTATAGAGGASRPAPILGYYFTTGMGGVGGNGSVSAAATDVEVGHPEQTVILWNGGGGGGGYLTSSDTSFSGANIILYNGSSYRTFGPIDIARGSTVAAGGSINGASAGANAPLYNICGKLSPGFGGAGGGGASATGATNGGRGYRGGGGGGGGASKAGVTAGSGGVGGNGYVCIIAFE